jgi:succinylglutamic semialdehyde dehydrogenase
MRPGLLLNGAWQEGTGPDIVSIDPWTDEEVWRVASASREETAMACAEAASAFPAWAATDLDDRIAILERYAERLKQDAAAISLVISRETGKTRWDADGEVAAMVGKIGISIAAYRERTGDRQAQTPFGAMALSHRPHGVMAVYGPFNFPGHLPNGHIVPALLAGNTVVFKPSELASATGITLVRALVESGLPDGVLNLVCGGRDTGAALLDQPELAGVLFTGSAQTGALIHRHFAGRPDVILALELGGNNPLIVWPPANPEAAASLIAHSAFITTGQRCSCARRLILPEGKPGDDILYALAALTDRLIVDRFNAEPAPFMGPLVSRRAGELARDFEEGLIALGGKPIRALEGQGAKVRPAIIDMSQAADSPDEECFAPLIQVRRASSLDQAIAMANATRFGLAGGLISDDESAWAIARLRLRAGVLNWNRPTTGASSALPFGGPGLSGSGRPSAYYAADYCAWPIASQMAPGAQVQPTQGLRP